MNSMKFGSEGAIAHISKMVSINYLVEKQNIMRDCLLTDLKSFNYMLFFCLLAKALSWTVLRIWK